MPRRRPSSCAQQVAPEGLPGGGDRRRRDPLLPLELRAASGAGASGGSTASEGGAEWWEAPACESSHSDPGVGVRRPRSRLPVLPTVAQRAARNRTGLSPGNRRPGPGQCEDPRRGSARENPDSLGDLLGEFLPGRSWQFLHQLRAESAEQPRPPTEAPTAPTGGASSASQHQRGVSEHSGSPPQCPRYSFLPDLGGQSLYFKNSLEKILLHQIPALGPFRRDHSQFTTVKKTNQPHATQAPKLKAVLTHNSSGEGSGHRRRCCPFCVRFADETLRDTALRYWERSCAVRQGILENRTASVSAASEQVFRSVGRWLESLPKALYPRAKEDTMANSFGWDFPGLSTLEPKGHLSEDTSMNSSLPFIPRPTTQRQRGDLKTFLEQESFLPSLVLHTVLKQGRPKGHQLLLPSTSRRTQR
ncbi:LOW QUALITY PROTEIN: uncharacterized protein C9orf50 homolog [Eubalaena glacialis]|uniref:LOW QUALITY PROTEIN: uncharacterized protein C9orf50 homolog n=1 Tax=Eubalaena glacialis TaxID=27606 RepID=UPI002A59BC71|nr:LOW QUALITY PROTEIN: uncharacterized protein C9orf50 homolog [Eubalaena glacialis]